MKLVIRLLPFFILTILVVFFFLPLFWPVPQIFMTPDSYLSDILHFHYPMKFLLSESLKHNQLPVWTDLVGTGFPPIGEGQIQALSLINLFLFKFFPLITAFNLQYVIVFVALSVGMYLVGREYGWSKLTASYCAIIFSFSGVHIVRIPHVNCLQALSYVPFMFWIILRMQKNKESKLWLLLPFLFSQQIYQGHYQYVFMTIFFFLFYIFLFWWREKKEDRPWILKTVLLIGLLSLGLSGAQLVPSFEYFLKSGGREGLTANPMGSFQLVHLLQFFSPYALGDNRIGTYPTQQFGVGFHETFSYIGVLPMVLCLASLFFIRKNTWVRNCWIMIIVLFLFVFEHNSPIYFLFSIPPFSWFRVYSRFLAYITFLFVLLSGFVFEQIRIWPMRVSKSIPRKSSPLMLILFICVVSIFDVWTFSSSYQPMLPVKTIEQLPELYASIPKNTRMSVIPYSSTLWLRYVYENGWKNPKDYLYLLNGGQPNYSLIHGLNNLSLYAGYLPQKQQRLLYTALESSAFDQDLKIATLSALSINTLRLHNTENLITSSFITNPEAAYSSQISSKNKELGPLYFFKLSGVKPKYYLTSTYKKIQFLEEYIEEAGKPDALSSFDAFLTTDRTLVPSKEQGTLSVVSDMTTKKIFSITTSADTFFIASLYLYPGWIALLDGKPVPIDPANISGMAVFIPKGTHTLIVQFIPKSLYLGFAIVGGTLLLYGFVILRSLSRARR